MKVWIICSSNVAMLEKFGRDSYSGLIITVANHGLRNSSYNGVFKMGKGILQEHNYSRGYLLKEFMDSEMRETGEFLKTRVA